MKAVSNYRPEIIDFTVETNQVPLSLGTFENADKARMFIAENLLGIQTKLTTTRFIDHVEIDALRDQYTDELENNLPNIKSAYHVKMEEYERAKQNKKEAEEMVNASLTKIQQLANEVNDRTTEINLDPEHTWEVVYNGKRFYYTFMDNEIKLAKIMDIASYEMDDLISSSHRNADFFENHKTAMKKAK